MTVGDVARALEDWAPKELAWERDNVGLQSGSPRKQVKKILVALDVSDSVIAEARRKGVDLIVSHHPLFFHPLKTINQDERVGRLATALLVNNIALYSAHTNLDFAPDGVSVALGEQLGLSSFEALSQDQQNLKKIVVFIPVEHIDTVLTAMARAGAGRIGQYDSCSFRTDGVGTFRPQDGARPFIGEVGTLERVRETKLEMIVPNWKLGNVVQAMRAAHPYEEVAYDVYDLSNVNPSSGAGVLGTLPKPMRVPKFLDHIRQALSSRALRYRGDAKKIVRRVAACGGGGSDLLPAAIRRDADAFVTADVPYHRFEESDNRIVLIDAGHFETEYPIVQKIVNYLRVKLSHGNDSLVQVFASRKATNPVLHYSS